MIRDNKTSCRLCPRSCGVDRQRGERGFCQAGSHITVAEISVSAEAEERILRGNGSVAQVFFSRCPLRCVFCSNSGISIQGYGGAVSLPGFVEELRSLRDRGVGTVFFVTPDPYLPWIAEALTQWRKEAPGIGVFCVTSGFLDPDLVGEMMRIFDTLIVSLKPVSAGDSEVLVGRSDYWSCARRVLERAASETTGGRYPPCIVRIVLMPGRLEIVKDQLRSLASVVPVQTPVNLLDFRPSYLWKEYGEWRRTRPEERSLALEYAHELGFDSIVD